MEAREAIDRIKALTGAGDFEVEKLVYDVLDYCNREDYPPALVYVAVELINKRLSDAANADNLPIKKIKQDDSEIEYAVNSVNVYGLISEQDFDSIKAKLRLYRRLKAL